MCPLICSRDNLPNTVLEAMACGNPVVGFADMVRNGVYGLMVVATDVGALAGPIGDLLNAVPDGRAWGKCAERPKTTPVDPQVRR